MIGVSEIGSSCVISIQGKFPLFSQIQYDKILNEAGYERKIDTKNNNQIYYQKEDVIIFANFMQNTINIRLFNTISIQTKYKEFITLLAKLNFKPEHVAIMGGVFNTFVTNIGDPQTFLNKFLNEKTKSIFGKAVQINPSVLSIVLANSSVKDIDLQVRMEPLFSSPQDSLFVNFIFKTTKYDAFSEFVSKFGADFISDIINSINEIP